MAVRKSTSFFLKPKLKEDKEKQHGSEEDLYFEMEYPEGKRSRSGTQDSDTVSFSSKSIESFGSECTNGSQDSPYRNGSRGSSVGPILERPSSLRFKRNNSYGSLPRTTYQKIPKFSFQNFSVPTTPADSWEQENNFLRKGDMTSSTSSVEEATESTLFKKTRSRLSLNLGVFDGSSSPGSPARSPKIIPKFLRSSFSKLMLKDKPKTPDTSHEPRSLPFLGNLFSSAQNSPRQEDPESHNYSPAELEDESSPPSTPTTKLFVEESLAKGLPIIPFNYPAFVIVEKNRATGKHTSFPQEPKLQDQEMPNRPSKNFTQSEPSSRKTSSLIQPDKEDFCLEEKSLKKLIGRAKREMEEEASLKKSSWIRGYAANNSRALLRRRSSVSEYVGMSIGAVKDISKQSYSILENSARRDSLSYYLSGRGKGKVKSRKSKFPQENVIKSPTMHSSDIKREKTDLSTKMEDYLDMSCGRNQS
eukprot:GFUD01011544.1.p1 GENE.GFUD01011544.1~~GFUD01011544.1.p1  ORF type:complete len:474 (+),score=100.91 GFUD01011544.1:145-1566(+)